ncbi:MAG TPA: HD domain-containing phosphohydrolase [Actinomycetota bacterium]|nr:HD domain-containing phosphohydrolase [Actinomycetota bacterium]
MSFASAQRADEMSEAPEKEWFLREQMLSLAHDLSTLYSRERDKTERLEATLEELEESYGATVRMLAFVIEAKDPHVHSHLERSFKYAKALARRIDPALAGDPAVQHGFLLHDIGKVGIPERILGKPGPLTGEEFEVMKTHPMIGSRIVEPVRALRAAADVIEGHHERWDGGGYPRGRKGEEIPLAARIFSIADSFDAMTSDRPYRKALTLEHALDEVRAGAGTQFDPDCVRAFLDMDWAAASG